MKTFKDCKIGDTVFVKIGLSIEQRKITALNGDRAVTCDNSYYSSSETKDWDLIKNETKATGYNRSEIICTTQDEAIMLVKEHLGEEIEKQAKAVEKEMVKLIDLKNEIFKYL